MNVLDKLKTRPTPNKQKQFNVVLKNTNDEKEEIIVEEEKKPEFVPRKVEIKDARKYSAINRDDIIEKLRNTKMLSVQNKLFPSKMPAVKETQNFPPVPRSEVKEKVEEMKETTQIMPPLPPQEIEKEEKEQIDNPIMPPKPEKIKIIRKNKKNVVITNIEPVEKPIEEPTNPTVANVTEELPTKKITITVKKPRKTQIMDLSKFEIGTQLMENRLPKEKEKIIYKASSYYMNNRKLFVQQIQKLFEPYKKELMANKQQISCDARSQSADVQLLLHQKIVRDYLNLYTPYRGLLLYHGLGSGKTCTSIAIAEGMKSAKQIIVMTPASLKMNFFTELKKCGDPIYKKNQFWEFISIVGQPQYLKILTGALSLTEEFVQKQHGAWLVDVTKPPNFTELSSEDQVVIDLQLNEMIRSKYKDINYNGITRKKMNELTENGNRNPFDNSVVVIDEAHNFVSRIVNKLKNPSATSSKLYHYLMNATNARVVLLTGTPIINYPNEIAILFNILRGYIKTWTFPLNISSTTQKITTETFLEMFAEANFKTYDYVEFSGNKLTITRNPFGFINMKKSGPAKKAGGKIKKGGTKKNMGNLTVSNNVTKKHQTNDEKDAELTEDERVDYEQYYRDQYSGMYNPYNGGVSGELIDMKAGGDGALFDKYNGVHLNETGNVGDDQFENIVKTILRKNNFTILEDKIEIKNNKVLPDDPETFIDLFIDTENASLKNDSVLKRRILGLTSYFRSAQEQLLPRFVLTETGDTYHTLMIEMSDHQFSNYEIIRKEERKNEKAQKRAKNKISKDEMTLPSSYRIYSRACCNFAFPTEVPRPLPDSKKVEDIDADNADDDMEEDKEPEEVEEYQKRIISTMEQLKLNSSQYFSPTTLEMYSPKFAEILENIQNEKNRGLHLLYSQFRTMEGIGIFQLVLEENGFAEFKIHRNSSTNQWEVVENPEDANKPKFALYTGTETAEHKEIIRNIYNGDWDLVPASITNKLREKNENNLYGEIIKLLMITASGAEGINLKNTRFVHIMEAYWNMVRTQQVVGRARRICSHEQLPFELRNVEVFIYLTVLSEEQKTSEKNKELILKDISRTTGSPISTDENLFEIAMLKENIIQQILKSIKESAMDCSLYSSLNPDEHTVCYGFGKVNSNAFASYPTLEQDVNEKEETKTEKIVFNEVTIQGSKYAINKKTMELYNFLDYEQSMKTGNVIFPIGKLVKTKTGYVVEKLT